MGYIYIYMGVSIIYNVYRRRTSDVKDHMTNLKYTYLTAGPFYTLLFVVAIKA